MKIYVNRQHVNAPWGGGNNFVAAITNKIKNSSHELCDPKDSLATPEAILLIGLNNEGNCISAEQAIYYKMFVNPMTKIVLRVNENDARKNTVGVDAALIKYSEYVDATIFVSKWLKSYFKTKGWKCKNNIVIKNGVDENIFKPGPKLNNGKINIVTHHWSNNYLKGFDFYDKIDSFVNDNSNEFSFTYIGRDRGTFSKLTNVIKPMYGETLGQELSKYDVYVSASRFDPGPNHVLESLACGLPTYVFTDGGGCVEFAGKKHVFSSWNDLEKTLLGKKFQSNKMKLSSWDSCTEEYLRFIEKL